MESEVNMVNKISFIILLLPIFTFIGAFAQEDNKTKMTVEFSCENIPDSGLLCSDSEMGLCLLQTNVSGDLTWNIVKKMLCEAR